ncbi:hypothetical protein PHMEG_00023753 [Phytophthora megakarya]|uniref:Tf2-1-like SH3-like domain-containing protein n=1 Tax=Phytophthora megakarya TaxID=4795 RepID=A0A225VIL3_9STRA|nr:hypothetical protein PHMEG_00023753 [Phytophthora megakarya]
MSEVFQAFAELIQARSRSTLSYRPQANGQQERSAKTVMQDPLQQDWDEIAERLVFPINNSHDMTRKETPFYLVHGWDAHTTLRAMTTSMKRGVGKPTKALVWRREINRQERIAPEMAKEYQAVEKARRARIHNEKLSPKSKSQYQKLAHRWHGPFRVKRKVEGFAYELELPDKSVYRFYPVVHVSRLKAVNEFCDRPKARLARDQDLTSTKSRCLKTAGWMPEEVAGEFEVEAILDD